MSISSPKYDGVSVGKPFSFGKVFGPLRWVIRNNTTPTKDHMCSGERVPRTHICRLDKIRKQIS